MRIIEAGALQALLRAANASADARSAPRRALDAVTQALTPNSRRLFAPPPRAAASHGKPLGLGGRPPRGRSPLACALPSAADAPTLVDAGRLADAAAADAAAATNWEAAARTPRWQEAAAGASGAAAEPTAVEPDAPAAKLKHKQRQQLGGWSSPLLNP